MNCKATRDRITAYADGTLDAAAAREIESHVSDCADCRLRLEETREVFFALTAWTVPERDELFWQRMRAQVRERTMQPAHVRRLRWGVARPGIRSATAFVTATLLFIIGYSMFTGVPRMQTPPAITEPVLPSSDSAAAAAPAASRDELIMSAVMEKPTLYPQYKAEPAPADASSANEQQQPAAQDESKTVEDFPYLGENVSDSELSNLESATYDIAAPGRYDAAAVVNDMTEEEAGAVLRTMPQ